MRRLFRTTGLALGLPFIVALVSSCADYATSTRNATAVRAGAAQANLHIGPQVVISQVYGGGGNAGATYKNDFIELHNRGTTSVNVGGWSVQYASATGTYNAATALAGTIPAGGYYLVQQAAGTTAGTYLSRPAPNATGSIAMSATSGKVILVTTAVALGSAGGTCPTVNVVDAVSFGTAATNCGRGTTATLANATAALRNTGGCDYSTASNGLATTFTVAPANPRNLASAPLICPDDEEEEEEEPVVDHVTIDPTSWSMTVGGTKQFTAQALDAANTEVPGATFTWAAVPTGIVTVSSTGLVTASSIGPVTVTVTSGGKSASASVQVDEAPLPGLPAVRFSELHYDNFDADFGEALEVEGPAGTSLAGWSVVLYNGNGGVPYDTRALTGVIPSMCSGRGVVTVKFDQDGIQNGPDGFALVDAGGSVVEFLSYEGTFTATAGPAKDLTSTSLGVSQASAPVFQTLQRRPSGIWEGPKPSSLGACYGQPRVMANFITFTGRLRADARLPIGMEDQIFASLRDANNAGLTSTFTWEAVTPAIATIDARGVIRAISAGAAQFRATAADGTTGTHTLETLVATAGTAQYGNHTEFGDPTDSDPSDDFILRRTEFTSSYSKARNIPNWVSYNLETTHIGDEDRCDCFTYDPVLPADYPRYTTADYTGAASIGFGIDRGHLARSFDRTAGALDNARTFYFSNIIPQASENNQGPWGALETYLGNQALNSNKEVYIIAGASGSQGTVKNEGIITIPLWTWKVAVIMPRDHGLANVNSWDDVQVIAVVMPNKPLSQGLNADWQLHKVTVDSVEALSGYDLLKLLPDQVEIALESNTRPPTASVNGPFTISEGGSVQFNGSASDPDAGQALTLSWNFGDGATGTGLTPSHSYAQNGSYTVTFTATDPLGLVATATTTVTVNNVAPTITSLNLPASIVSGTSLGASATFTDPGPDAPWSFSFAWSDGSPTTGFVTSPAVVAAASHTYLAAGTYTVRFTITDKDGGSDFTERQVQVVRLQVASDVNPNRINLNDAGNGRVMVRVLSSATFDATSVDVSTARVGGVAPVSNSVDDVNGDGRADLVLHFERDALIEAGTLTASTTQLVLLANLSDGRQIESRASVRTR